MTRWPFPRDAAAWRDNRCTPRTAGRAGIVLLSIALGACDSGEPSGESDKQLVDKAVQQTQQRMAAALRGSGLATETGDGGLAVGYQDGKESAQIGQNLPIPGWLPPGFPLPEDLSIQLVTTDLEGRKELSGASSAVQTDVLREQVARWAADNGWELIPAKPGVIILASGSGEVIDAIAEDAVGLRLRLSRRSVARDRQTAAVERVGPGMATVILGGVERSLQGECRIKGNRYGFEHAAQDGGSHLSVLIQAADSQPQGTASFGAANNSGYTQYSINFPMDSADTPKVQAAGNGFEVQGNFASAGTGGLQWLPGSIVVSCTPSS